MEGHPFYADYNASKAGVILLVKTIALEFAPYLRVNVICLRRVLTQMQKSKYTSEMIKEINSAISLIRHAKP